MEAKRIVAGVVLLALFTGGVSFFFIQEKYGEVSKINYCELWSAFCSPKTQEPLQKVAQIPETIEVVEIPQKNGTEADPVSWDAFYCGFYQYGPDYNRLVAIHAALNNAIRRVGGDFGEATNKDEVAAFLGQASHESDYLKAKREYCSLPENGAWCLEHYQYGSWCPGVNPAPGKYYYGRGFMQLTWNCNYNAAGIGLGRDLLANPDQVEWDDNIAWETAIWFWNANGCPAPARNLRFGDTTRIINSMECNGGNTPAQDSRVSRYQTLRKCLGLPTENDWNRLYC